MSLLRKFIFILALLPALSWANPININTANAQALASLSGLGPAKAAAIVSYRENNGPFKSIDGLTGVKGIGNKTVEKLRSQLTIETK